MSWYFHRSYLQDVYHKRKGKNTSYSLRAYARDLKIGHSTLCGVLKGERFMSYKTSFDITKVLKLNECLRFLFFNSVAKEKKATGNQKIEKEFAIYLNQIPNEKNSGTLKLSSQNGKILSEWHFYAILELTLVEDFESSAEWIAKKLKLKPVLVYEAIDLLFTMGLLQNLNGRWSKTFLHFTGPDKNQTNEFLKNRQIQILEKSIESIKSTSIENRSHNAMTMAINREKLPIAKEEIRKFLFKMCELLEVDQRKDVYELQIGLFPLTELNS